MVGYGCYVISKDAEALGRAARLQVCCALAAYRGAEPDTPPAPAPAPCRYPQLKRKDGGEDSGGKHKAKKRSSK